MALSCLLYKEDDTNTQKGRECKCFPSTMPPFYKLVKGSPVLLPGELHVLIHSCGGKDLPGWLPVNGGGELNSFFTKIK